MHHGGMTPETTLNRGPHRSESPGEPDLTGYVTFRLSRLQAALNAQAAQLLAAGAGLTLTQWRILALIGADGQTTHGALMRSAAFDKGMLSRTLAAMIEQGLLSDARDDVDHRRQILRITPLGVMKRDQAAPLMKARRARLMRDFSDTETEALLAALDKLMAAAMDKEPIP
jgi:DNA-binding MarR family transcriptional regulator